MQKKPATMRDVARRAGLNQSTVSRVLSSTGRVSISADVRRRVRRIARALDYHHNPSAVALRTGATRTVMVVVSDMTDMFYSAILSGIQEILAAEGYALVLHSLAHAGPPADLSRFLRRYRFDGALMLGALPSITDDGITTLAGQGLPLVLIGRSLEKSVVSSVTAANGSGGRLVAAHLVSLGHRRIAVMRGPRAWPDIAQRVAGFRREFAVTAAVPDGIRLCPCSSRQMASGYSATAKLLAAWRPTAIFCMNDATAIGSMRAIREAGLRIPADISVVGFDDGELAEFSLPPLTSIRQPRLRMGREGARQLVQAMNRSGAQREAQHEAQHAAQYEAQHASLVLDVELVVRGSTCPPP
jgi:LacI family transcriptional regulator